MANELCLDDSCAGPRISFSRDFSERGIVPIEQRPPQSSSLNSDFCFHNDTINLESPLADELFLNGKIVPVEIKKIIPPLTHAQEQPVCPTPQPQVCLDATLTGKDSSHESLNVIKINTSKGNSIDQEFSSLREPFLNREIIIPLKFKKKKNISPPFSLLGAFLDAADENDEDTNKGSNRWMIKNARNKPDGHEKQNSKQSSRFKRRSSWSLTIVT
ncbi:PREDICTED: uncharacterized protein LOC105123384 isoform X2 [Populus euphratica]|uniref:Uncharacterized protein LOC105123384 isoform X2 n=1 Tax=Populus euphratica TaxID=75702 RepID=A0AAJ6U2R8_POPEU|nr:PREDICTED: uncharacterized protein LOC105123384 isoform X2 [Populus euphratica]